THPLPPRQSHTAPLPSLSTLIKPATHRGPPPPHARAPSRHTGPHPGATPRVAVDDDHPAIPGLAPLARLGKLPGVERPIAPAPDDDHVAHHDAIGRRRARHRPRSREESPRSRRAPRRSRGIGPPPRGRRAPPTGPSRPASA